VYLGFFRSDKDSVSGGCEPSSCVDDFDEQFDIDDDAGLSHFTLDDDAGLSHITLDGDAGLSHFTLDDDAGLSHITLDGDAGLSHFTLDDDAQRFNISRDVLVFLHIQKTVLNNRFYTVILLFNI